MVKFNSKQMDIIRQLNNLFEDEHGGCGETTCTMRVAFQAGYDLVAINDWISSGVASDEFCELYAKLPAKMLWKAVREQSKEFCKEVAHDKCPECNAVVWHGDAEATTIDCDSCGGSYEKNDLRSIVKRIAKANQAP